MKKTVLLFLICCGCLQVLLAQRPLQPIPSLTPGKYQLEQIERQYGMFLHFGINTFYDHEWSDGSLPPSLYHPAQVDADQWVRTAKEAGMKYVILITKHHDGFCLWNSRYTDYDVNSSGNTTNVVASVARACKKYDIGLGLYYSLWDRHQNANTKDSMADKAYNQFMLAQLNELIAIAKKEHTPIVEFWFDGGWEKPNYRWPVAAIYSAIKAKEPQCQVGINWSIGTAADEDQHMVLPGDQKEGFPIRYFPSDFRLGDPYLPADPDPKIFSHNGQQYYMPWESTICISKYWFYNTADTSYMPLDELEKKYTIAIAQQNILILNTPPGRDGKIRKKDIELLMQLKSRINKMKTVAGSSR